MTDWIKNAGTVPDDVGHETVIEVECRDGEVKVWREDNDDSNRWSIRDSDCDIIRWRKTEVKLCTTCKHFRPHRDLFNLWGLVRGSTYIKFAECAISDLDGITYCCSILRRLSLDSICMKHLCNKEGRKWEKK